MTDQSPNAVFHASSFLQGQKADYIDHLHAHHAEGRVRLGKAVLKSHGRNSVGRASARLAEHVAN